jgi:hypothetical protein
MEFFSYHFSTILLGLVISINPTECIISDDKTNLEPLGINPGPCSLFQSALQLLDVGNQRG